MNGKRDYKIHRLPCTTAPTAWDGGFAGYGIYPQYKDYYAFHMFL